MWHHVFTAYYTISTLRYGHLWPFPVSQAPGKTKSKDLNRQHSLIKAELLLTCIQNNDSDFEIPRCWVTCAGLFAFLICKTFIWSSLHGSKSMARPLQFLQLICSGVFIVWYLKLSGHDVKKRKKKKAGLGKELKIKMKLISQKRQNGVFWFLSTSWALLEGLGCKQPPDVLLSQEVTSIFLTSSESGSPKHGAVTLLAVGVTAMLCHG